MYRGFKLKDFTFKDEQRYLNEGKKEHEKQKREVNAILKDFLFSDGKLDGTAMQNNWFPQIKADIFISHAHEDQNLAIACTTWLKEEFGLNCFLDSSVWGNSNDLLRLIDDAYCYNPKTETYRYGKRNISTSHVHMMLSTALSMMIDNIECLFFINTPASIQSEGLIDRTESPWIYAEIATSKLIRKKSPERHRAEKTRTILKAEEKAFSESFKITHDVQLDHLTELSVNDLNHWQSIFPILSPDDALDNLYLSFPLKKQLNG